MKHFISLKDFSAKEIRKLIQLALKMKKNPSSYKNYLAGKAIGLLFEKASLRTKTAFYLGALQLGAEVIYYAPEEVKLGQREKVSDVARTLSGYLDLAVLRTFSHKTILDFKAVSGMPVVNGLSNLLHPSQVLADIMTIEELKGNLQKLKVTYIGDGNNVCASLINAFFVLGGKLTIASPVKYLPKPGILKAARKDAAKSKAVINLSSSVVEAARGADVLYTDVWVSMGNEKETIDRKKAFKKFRIDDTILKHANKDCLVLHCLPAHRGEEITDSVIDGKQSAVFQQAENRLYTAKAILYYLLRK